MRQHNNNKNNNRSRGRGGRKNPNPLTRSYESNGPDVKVRGTAQHVADKYQTLARDALSSGDGISAEAYFQHAEHYNRIIMTAQAQQNAAREEERRNAPQPVTQPQVNSQSQANNEQPSEQLSGEAASTESVGGDDAQPAVVDTKSDDKSKDEDQPKPRRRRASGRQPRRSDAKQDTAATNEPTLANQSDTIMDNPPAFLMTD